MNKRRTIKKGLAILLVVAMLFSIMPVSAFAENTGSTEPGGQKLMNMQSKTTTPAAYVTIGDVTRPYETLNEAIEAVENCTAGDNAVVTLAKDITLVETQNITFGVFTLDLNGKTLETNGGATTVLKIKGGTVTIQNGTIRHNVDTSTNGNVAVNVSYENSPTVDIIDCDIISITDYGIVFSGNVTLSGKSSISGGSTDLFRQYKTGNITLEEEVEFPGGLTFITPDEINLNSILGDGMAYWQGNTKVTLGEENNYGFIETTPYGYKYEISGDVTVKAIPKQTPTYTAPTNLTAVYGQTLADVMFEENSGFSWMDSTLSVGNAGEQTHKAKFTPNDTVNYEVVEDIDVIITVSAKEVTSPTITLAQDSYTYTGSAIEPVVTVKDGETTIPADEYTVSYSNNVNAGTATVTITDKDGGNYAVNGSTEFTINKATVAEPTIESKVYTGAVLKADVAENALYTVTNNNGGTAKGSYPVVLTLRDSANYKWSTVDTAAVTLQFVISGDDDNDDTNNPPQGDGNGDNNTGDNNNDGTGEGSQGGTDNDSTSTPSYSYTPSTPAAKPEITVPDNAVGEDVKVEAEKITTSTLNDVKDIASDDDKLSVIGGKDSAVQIKATEDNKAVESFTQPVTVTVPVSKSALKNVEDVNKLTLALVTEDENGDTVLTYVGGNYDAEEGTFSAYTDKPGNYVLVEKQDIVKMNLLIGNLASTINGETVINDVAPYIVNDRTMVPVAFIMGNLGCQVEWINDERKVVITLPDGEQLSMIIDQEIPGFGGIPVIKNDRTMVPIAYIADVMGAHVLWVGDEQRVVIVK